MRTAKRRPAVPIPADVKDSVDRFEQTEGVFGLAGLAGDLEADDEHD